MLTLIDQYSRECLAIDVKRRLNSEDVIDCLTQLFFIRGTPAYIRSDKGTEFTSHKVRAWLEQVNVTTLFITPGSPWENGYIESFNGTLGDELLKPELFDTLTEARVLIERWRRHYNQVRSHSSLGYRSPAPETIVPSRFSNFATLSIKYGLSEKRMFYSKNWYPSWGQFNFYRRQSRVDDGSCVIV